MAVHSRKQLLLKLYLCILIAAKASCQPLPGCPGSCGNLRIHYPFGIREGCYLDDSFFIKCDNTTITTSSNTTLVPYLPQSNIPILSLALDSGELRVSSHIVPACPAKNSTRGSPRFNFTHHFSISPTKNAFVAVGCNIESIKVTVVACATSCDNDDPPANKSCAGAGCCDAAVPNGLSGFRSQTTSLDSNSGFDQVGESCAYAFVAEVGAYEFLTTDLTSSEIKTLPVVLDWAVGNQTCQEAKHDDACKAEHSECHNSIRGVGYICKCLTGFEGNPYLHGGCQDIKECSTQPNLCIGQCHELEGGFKCSCPAGQEGDGLRTGGKGCHPNAKWNVILIIAFGILALLVGSLCIYVQRKRKLIQSREKYFRQNGGLFLQQEISHRLHNNKAIIFTIQELKKATNNFDKARVIGRGRCGRVYGGLLPDNRVAAIKKSKIYDGIFFEVGLFIKELVMLSAIHHKNIAGLLGCYLETEVPLLVYEYIPNGTLFDNIHIEGQLSWSTRLRIARDTAGALAYLHSLQIIHTNVKSANILLDECFTAKVSDVGAPKINILDWEHLNMVVVGTISYLDPEYFITSVMTEKSDVYSFGVVLAELVTSQEPISFSRYENDRHISAFLCSSIREGRLTEILDHTIVKDANVEAVEQMIKVANLASCCLMVEGAKRPTMEEVKMKLDEIMSIEKQSSEVCDEEEAEYSPKVIEALNIVHRGDANHARGWIIARRCLVSVRLYFWRNYQYSVRSMVPTKFSSVMEM